VRSLSRLAVISIGIHSTLTSCWMGCRIAKRIAPRRSPSNAYQKGCRKSQTQLIGVNAMNIARLLKADERSDFFKSVIVRSAASPAPKPHRPESIFLHRQSRPVSAPTEIKDCERKSPAQDLLWVDMIANALIVIVIASASYLFISAKGLPSNIDPVVTSFSEPSQPR
jgi:hypothetical protein